MDMDRNKVGLTSEMVKDLTGHEINQEFGENEKLYIRNILNLQPNNLQLALDEALRKEKIKLYDVTNPFSKMMMKIRAKELQKKTKQTNFKNLSKLKNQTREMISSQQLKQKSRKKRKTS